MHPQQPARTPKCFRNSAAKAVSITQVVCGGIAIVLGIVIIVLDTGHSYTGYPIWTGALFLSTGIVGIFAAIRKTTCMIITFMILSIVSAVFTMVVLGLASSAVEWDRWRWCWDSYCPQAPARTAMDALLIILALLEAGLSITSSVMTCCAICSCCTECGGGDCCCSDGGGYQPPSVAYQVGADGRLVQVPGQYVIQGQPIAMTPFPPSQPQQAAVLPTGATVQQPMFVTQAPANMAVAQGNVGHGQGPKPHGNVVLVPAGPQAQRGVPTPHPQPQMIQPLPTTGGNIQYVFATSTPVPVPQAARQQQPQAVPQVQFQQPNLAVPSPTPAQPQQPPNEPDQQSSAPPTGSSPPPSYQSVQPEGPVTTQALPTEQDDVPLIEN